MKNQEIIKKLADVDFQEKLLGNPHQALQQEGMAVSPAIDIKVLRNSKNTINIVLPLPYNQGEETLTDDDLAALSAGEVVMGIGLAAGVTFAVVGVLAGIGASVFALVDNV